MAKPQASQPQVANRQASSLLFVTERITRKYNFFLYKVFLQQVLHTVEMCCFIVNIRGSPAKKFKQIFHVNSFALSINEITVSIKTMSTVYPP